MNEVVHFAMSISLLVFVGATSFASSDEILDNQILNNYVGEYDSEVKDLLSTTCVHYNYRDDCHKSNDGCPKQYKKCSTEVYGSRPSCYVAWMGNKKILQGCWASDEPCREQCLGTRYSRNINFCCCTGNNCNERYGLENEVPVRR